MAQSNLGVPGQNVQGLAATIASGQQISSAIPLNGLSLCGVFIPTGFTGTAITFLACATSGGTFVPVFGTSGSALSLSVAAGNYYALDPAQFQGISYLQIKSGSSEAAARSLTYSMKGI